MQITITNGTLTNIQETLSPSQGYSLPPSVTVNGATSSYSDSTGLLQLTSPTSSMSVSASGVAVVTPSISIGSLSLSDVYVGSTKISKIYLGSTLLWEAPTPQGYEIGFTGMAGSQTSLTRTGDALGATWAASSGVITFDGIDLTKIFGGYAGSNGEELTWDSANSVYKNGNTTYTGDVGVKINRFFCKPIYDQNSKLDGYSLYFGNSAPDSSYEDWFLGKDHVWIGCYKARGGGMDNGLQSKQGLSYKSSTSASAIVTAYKKNSSTAYSLHAKWYNENAILQVLFMALFATKQTEDVYPQATYRHKSNDTRATGYMDSYRAQSLFAYEPTGDSGKRGNMFLGIEDFVGWGYELVCGVMLSDQNIATSTDYANFSYSGSYTNSGLLRPAVNDYITELQETPSVPGLLVPKSASGGSDSTYFCDYAYYSAGNMVWYQGASNPFTYGGVFYFVGNFDAWSSNTNYAARLCGKPV